MVDLDEKELPHQDIENKVHKFFKYFGGTDGQESARNHRTGAESGGIRRKIFGEFHAQIQRLSECQ